MELLESIAGDNAETHAALEKIKAKTAGLTPAQARQVQEQISHIVDVTAGRAETRDALWPHPPSLQSAEL